MKDIEVDWHLGDCRDVMKTIPDQSIDAVFCDPPYPEIDRDYGRMTEEEWHDMMHTVVVECRRILKPRGSAAFVLQPNYGKIGQTRLWVWEFLLWAGKYWNLVEDAYWWNTCSLPNAGCERKNGLMRRSVKPIVWIGDPDCYRYQDDVLWSESDGNARDRHTCRIRNISRPSGNSVDTSKSGISSIVRGGVTPFNLLPIGNTTHAGVLGHGAGTPYELSAWWVRYLCAPGGIVCDPFMGTGTTGRAAISQGRGFVGIEKEPHHFKTAATVLSAAIMGLST